MSIFHFNLTFPEIMSIFRIEMKNGVKEVPRTGEGGRNGYEFKRRKDTSSAHND